MSMKKASSAWIRRASNWCGSYYTEHLFPIKNRFLNTLTYSIIMIFDIVTYLDITENIVINNKIGSHWNQLWTSLASNTNCKTWTHSALCQLCFEMYALQSYILANENLPSLWKVNIGKYFVTVNDVNVNYHIITYHNMVYLPVY